MGKVKRETSTNGTMGKSQNLNLKTVAIIMNIITLPIVYWKR